MFFWSDGEFRERVGKRAKEWEGLIENSALEFDAKRSQHYLDIQYRRLYVGEGRK